VASIQGPRGAALSTCNAGVRGLALLDAHLYVLTVGRGSTDIAVHHVQTSSSSASSSSKRAAVRRLGAVPGLRDGADLVACRRQRCLYVADVGSDCVHRLHGLDATLNAQSWPVGDKPWGLSVTSVGHGGLDCRNHAIKFGTKKLESLSYRVVLFV